MLYKPGIHHADSEWYKPSKYGHMYKKGEHIKYIQCEGLKQNGKKVVCTRYLRMCRIYVLSRKEEEEVKDKA